MKKILLLVAVLAVCLYLSNVEAGYRERHRVTKAGVHSHFHSVGRASCSGTMMVRAMSSCSGKAVRAKSCSGPASTRAVRMKVRSRGRSCPVGGC